MYKRDCRGGGLRSADRCAGGAGGPVWRAAGEGAESAGGGRDPAAVRAAWHRAAGAQADGDRRGCRRRRSPLPTDSSGRAAAAVAAGPDCAACARGTAAAAQFQRGLAAAGDERDAGGAGDGWSATGECGNGAGGKDKAMRDMLHIKFVDRSADESFANAGASRGEMGVDPGMLMKLVSRNAKNGAQFTPQGVLRWPLTSAQGGGCSRARRGRCWIRSTWNGQ